MAIHLAEIRGSPNPLHEALIDCGFEIDSRFDSASPDAHNVMCLGGLCSIVKATQVHLLLAVPDVSLREETIVATADCLVAAEHVRAASVYAVHSQQPILSSLGLCRKITWTRMSHRRVCVLERRDQLSTP